MVQTAVPGAQRNRTRNHVTDNSLPDVLRAGRQSTLIKDIVGDLGGRGFINIGFPSGHLCCLRRRRNEREIETSYLLDKELSR